MSLHPKYFLGKVFIRTDAGTMLEITDQLQALDGLADELAALNGLTASVTELNYNDNATPGGLDASKTVIRTASSGIALKTLAVNAAGSNQGNGTALTADVNIVSQSDGTKGVVLPTAIVGHSVRVINNVATQTLKVYPATGGQINALGANVAHVLGPGQAATYHASALLTWHVEDGAGVTATTAELNLVDNQVAAAVMTVGAEGGNVINVGIQLNDAAGSAMATRSSVFAYLSNDANGDSVCTTAPNGGVAIGTDGLLIGTPQTVANAILVDGNLAISGGDAAKFKTTQTACFTINGLSYTKAATDALTFTAAHVISANKFGVVLVQINGAGTVSTKVPLTPQIYDDAPTALAALPSADANNVALGYIAIANNAVDWTANTSNMTDGDGVTTAVFNDTAQSSITAVPKAFWLTSEADGDIDINITDTGTPTFYLAVVLPNGKLNVSSAITFA